MPPLKAQIEQLDIDALQATHKTNFFELKIIQQPEEARTISQKQSSSKWPVDPPPILELVSSEKSPELWLHIHNPNWFCATALELIELDKPRGTNITVATDNFTGQQVSSLHKVKFQGHERGFFSFGDLNIKAVGRYRLHFTLFELRRASPQPDGSITHTYAEKVHSVVSQEFKVHSARSEQTRVSSELSKALSEAGVKIRIRKEATKRRAYQMDWSSKPHESLNKPTQLAPIRQRSQMTMGPPPPGSARANRIMGEDISKRATTTHEPLSTNSATVPPHSHAVATEPYYPAPRQAHDHFQRDGTHNWQSQAAALPIQSPLSDRYDVANPSGNFYHSPQSHLGWQNQMHPAAQGDPHGPIRVPQIHSAFTGDVYGAYIPQHEIRTSEEGGTTTPYQTTESTQMDTYPIYGTARASVGMQPPFNASSIEPQPFSVPTSDFTFHYNAPANISYPGPTPY